MVSEALLRKTLYFSFFYNIFGGLTFMFPTALGQTAGLPIPAPFLYSWFIGTNILLFALVSLWLAKSTHIAVPLLTVFAISKIIFCALMVTSWQLGEINPIGGLLSGVDLVMGIIFLLGAQTVTSKKT